MTIKKALQVVKKRVTWLEKRVDSQRDSSKVSFDLEEIAAHKVLIEIAEERLNEWQEEREDYERRRDTP